MIRRVTVRWPDRVFAMTSLRLILWVAIVLFTHEGILSDPFKLADWMDDHQFYSWEQSDRTTLLRYRQLPAWNPFWCGGTAGIAAPEDPFLGPDFLLRLVFGVAHGRRLAIMLLVVLGFEGMYRLCRRFDSSAVASAFAAVVFGTCERFVSFIHDGWVNFMGFELIPFVLYFFVEGTWGPAGDGISPEECRRRMFRARFLGAFFVAWLVMSAGTYPTPYSMLAVGYLTIALSVHASFNQTVPEQASTEPRRWRALLRSPGLAPWVSALTIGGVALALSAGKMLPTLSFVRQFPRVFTPVEAHPAAEVFTSFWGKYSAVAVLAFVGVVTADTAAGIFLAGALLFFAFQMGDHGPGSPFHLLKSLPIFGQLRFPHRFLVMVLLFASVAASRGITRIEDAVPVVAKRASEALLALLRRLTGAEPRPYPAGVSWAFVGLGALLAYLGLRPHTTEILTSIRIRPGTMYVDEAPRPFDGPFRQSRGNRRDVHLFTTANLGSMYCVAGNPLPESALLRGDLPAEEYPQDPSKATVKRLEWTPNEITLEVNAREPTTVLVNQNWAPQWTASVGSVKSFEKLLAVDVPAGKSVVVLAYKDRFLTFCLFLSLASGLGVALVFGRDGVRWLKRERARWQTLPTWPHDKPPASELVGSRKPGGSSDAPNGLGPGIRNEEEIEASSSDSDNCD